jgi:hypothetical protein
MAFDGGNLSIGVPLSYPIKKVGVPHDISFVHAPILGCLNGTIC